jgi:hypothetical protein
MTVLEWLNEEPAREGKSKWRTRRSRIGRVRRDRATRCSWQLISQSIRVLVMTPADQPVGASAFVSALLTSIPGLAYQLVARALIRYAISLSSDTVITILDSIILCCDYLCDSPRVICTRIQWSASICTSIQSYHVLIAFKHDASTVTTY